jgi:hypothetical protein
LPIVVKAMVPSKVTVLYFITYEGPEMPSHYDVFRTIGSCTGFTTYFQLQQEIAWQGVERARHVIRQVIDRPITESSIKKTAGANIERQSHTVEQDISIGVCLAIIWESREVFTDICEILKRLAVVHVLHAINEVEVLVPLHLHP